MKNTVTSKLALAAAAVALGAGGLYAAIVGGSAATVNGEPILNSEYEKNLASVIEQYQKSMPAFLEQKDGKAQIGKKVLDQMIDDMLLSQQAEKAGVKVKDRELEAGVAEVKKRFATDESGKALSKEAAEAAFQDELKKEGLSFAQFQNRIKKQLMVRKYIDETIRPKIKQPSDEETHKLFDTMRELIKGDTDTLKGMAPEDAQDLMSVAQRLKELTAERVRVRHILIRVAKDAPIVDRNKALEQANNIKKMLDGGADFADLAKKYSQDPESAVRGGDIGFIIRGWMTPEFEKKAFSMDVGAIGGPVETPFGYHIIRVEEKKAAQTVMYDDIKGDLSNYLAGRQMQQELLTLVKGLRDKASIQITQTDKK